MIVTQFLHTRISYIIISCETRYTQMRYRQNTIHPNRLYRHSRGIHKPNIRRLCVFSRRKILEEFLQHVIFVVGPILDAMSDLRSTKFEYVPTELYKVFV